MSNSRLPPNVDGCVRGHLRLHIPFMLWQDHNENQIDYFQVHVSFWGQDSVSVLSPFCNEGKARPLANLNTVVKYDVCCSLKRFAHYLNDMNFLDLFINLDGKILGSSRVGQLHFLDLSTPIAGLYPIMNQDLTQKLGEVFVSLSLSSCRSCRHSKSCKTDVQSKEPTMSDTNRYRRGPCRENMFHDQLSLKKSLKNILEKAISLRNNSFASGYSERMPPASYDTKWNLGEFVTQIFQDDSSPDESLLEAILFPKTSLVNKAPPNEDDLDYKKANCKNKAHEASSTDWKPSEDETFHNSEFESVHLDQFNPNKIKSFPQLNSIKDVRISSVQDPNYALISEHIKLSLKCESNKRDQLKPKRKPAWVDSRTAPVDSKANTSDALSLQTKSVTPKVPKPKTIKAIVNNHVEKVSKDLESTVSQKELLEFKAISDARRLEHIEEKNLRLTISSLRLNDNGINLLGRSHSDWCFNLEVRMPVLKGGGLGIWDYKGHRMTSDLQVAQFTSCIFNRGVVFFNQEKEFESVDRSQNIFIRLEAKNSRTQLRRSFGSCTLPLTDISDTKVILPISTVQPIGQLSLSITALRLPMPPSPRQDSLVPQKLLKKTVGNANQQSDKRVTISSKPFNALDNQNNETPPDSLSTSSVPTNSNAMPLIQCPPNPDKSHSVIKDVSLPVLQDEKSRSRILEFYEDKLSEPSRNEEFYNVEDYGGIFTNVDVQKVDGRAENEDKSNANSKDNNDNIFESFPTSKVNLFLCNRTTAVNENPLKRTYFGEEKIEGIRIAGKDLVEVQKGADIIVNTIGDAWIEKDKFATADEATNNAPLNQLETYNGLEELQNKEKECTVCIEKAVNLPVDVINTFVVCDCGGNITVKTKVSEHHLWNSCEEVVFNPWIIKGLHLKLFQCSPEYPLSHLEVDRKPSWLVGESFLDVRSLRWLSFLNGWYQLRNKDSIIGQIKVSVWPRKPAHSTKQDIIESSKQRLSVNTWSNWREDVDNLTETLESLKLKKRPRKLSVVDYLKRNVGKMS